MATVSGVHLTIERVEGARRRRKVTVTYTVCFSHCESLAGSTFIEEVKLRGDDPIWDDNLLTMHKDCLRASSGCVTRRFERIVADSTLDEDPDTIILGWVIGDKDEVYARVKLTPFAPSGAQADSNLVTADFGPAGA